MIARGVPREKEAKGDFFSSIYIVPMSAPEFLYQKDPYKTEEYKESRCVSATLCLVNPLMPKADCTFTIY